MLEQSALFCNTATSVLRRTALHLASKMDKYDMVRLLVANGASLAAAGRDGYSCSHAATRG